MAFPTGSSMSGVKSDKGGSTYNYSTGMQPNGTQSIGNWNTGGSVVGSGNSKGVFAPDGSRIGGQTTDPRLTGGQNINPYAKAFMTAGYSKQPYPGGYAGVVNQRTLGPIAAPVRYSPPPGVDTDIPNVLGTPPAPVMSQYGPRAQIDAGQTMTQNPAMGFSLANFNNQGTWGGAQQTTINKSPGGGGYTNINKNGGGYGYGSYGGPR